jgi:hypothetical protein
MISVSIWLRPIHIPDGSHRIAYRFERRASDLLTPWT